MIKTYKIQSFKGIYTGIGYTNQALPDKASSGAPKRVRNELLNLCIIFFFLLTSYQQAFSCIITTQEAEQYTDTSESGRIGYDLPSYLTDYIELAAFREMPAPIDYRTLIPEHRTETYTRTQAIVGLLTGLTWGGIILGDQRQRGKHRRRYYFSKRHVRIVKRRRKGRV